jgi:hypothetical protein
VLLVLRETLEIVGRPDQLARLDLARLGQQELKAQLEILERPDQPVQQVQQEILEDRAALELRE